MADRQEIKTEMADLEEIVPDGTAEKSGHNPSFRVDMNLIRTTHLKDEDDDLRGLGLNVFNQEELEQGVIQQVDQAIEKEEEERRKNLLRKEMKNINEDIKNVKHELASLATQLAQLGQGKRLISGGANRRLDSAKRQKENKLSQMKTLEARKKNIQAKLEGRLPLTEKDCAEILGLGSSSDTDRDRMIRTGEMTPFGTVVKQEKETAEDQSTSRNENQSAENQTAQSTRIKPDKSGVKDKVQEQVSFSDQTNGSNIHGFDDNDLYDAEIEETGDHRDKDDEWLPSDQEQGSHSDDEMAVGLKEEREVKPRRKGKKSLQPTHKRPVYHSNSEGEGSDENSAPRIAAVRKYRDDGNEDYFDARMEKFHISERRKQKLREAGQMSDSDDDEEFDGGLKVPSRIWSKLYKYQKTCVKWLWELHCQEAGGIVGDEMGLGKTIQTIAFLAGLKYSRLKNKNFSHMGLGATLVVCPTTVMHQWVKEFHAWWPPFRVAILHSSGTFTGKEHELIRHIVKNNGILVTSYNTLVIQQDNLLPYNWHYVILDEGHKIRNPDVQATLVSKQFRTPHRIILSGSPIQNNLKELWSLMDFVFPGKLGTLPDFMQHFAVPILQGGYANASPTQVQTAYKCACVLRDTINPYLLRRMKADVKVNLNLPAKNEQVLFCRLTDDQREVYQEYLESRECQAILNRTHMIFAGLITLRKICNHPDLSTGGPRVFRGEKTDGDPTLEYGYWKRAGKMIVVEALLKLWKKQGHRALIFTQSTQMLDVMEAFVQDKKYSYVRMDGGTAISARQPLVQKYNDNSGIYLFLLTTRVGGLGVNLVGADRIIIYDPDWNPSTDTQARERAWRIGQKRNVTIYRLLTTGTIEEKIYHRQIFKQFLTNRVLKDPKQRRLFKTNDLYELFSLGLSDDKRETETAAIFAGTGSNVSVDMKRINRFDRMKAEKKKPETEEEEEEEERKDAELNFNEDEISRMREMARKLSQKIGQGLLSSKNKDQKSSGDSGSDSMKHKGKSDGERESQNKNESGKNKSSGHKTDSGNSDSASEKNKNEDHAKKYDKLNYKIKKKAKTNEQKTEASVDLAAKASSVSEKREKTESVTHGKSSVKPNSGSEKRHRENDEHDRERKHKKKKHKRKDAKFEGERISHLDKLRDYKLAKQEEAREKKEQRQHDDYVLHRLFKKTGIQGALKHDKIMEPGHHDYVIVEQEAEKVAKEAASAMKRSRSLCLPATAGVPSWTGQHGGTKRPRFGQKKNTMLSGPEQKEKSETNNKAADNKSGLGDRHFDGSLAGSVQTNLETGSSASTAVSSTDLLNKMRVRNEVFSKNNGDDEEDDNGIFVSDENSLELLKRMREFIMFECRKFGQATTKELLKEFGPKLPSSNSAKFKAMLNSICDFDKDAGVWKLKSDFK